MYLYVILINNMLRQFKYLDMDKQSEGTRITIQT